MLKPLSLYIHIPFCIKKCNYCDFLSLTGMSDYFDAYIEKLVIEIKAKSVLLKDYEIKTIFIGGGTPTVIKAEQLCHIINTIKNEYACAKKMEVTIEANPKTVDSTSLSMLRSVSCRISFGLQSNNNRLLQEIGRIHDTDTFENNFNEARQAGFCNINVDLMYALPNQSLKDWEDALDYIIKINPEHVSAYGLIPEVGTVLHEKLLQGELNMHDDEMYLKMYYMAKRKLKDSGYKHYEISNFAKKGYECKHNMVYWRCMEYVGFGLGASSYIDSFRFRNEFDLRKYLNDSTMERFDVEKIGLNDSISEFMFMGLRMIDGVSLNDFKRRFGASLSSVYGKTLKDLMEKGLISYGTDRVYLTEKGIDISNFVFSELII